MILANKIDQDMKDAMRNRDKLALAVIRMVKSDILLAVKDKKEDLTDDEVIDIIGKHIKMRNDSIREFQKANRIDLVEINKKEIEILTKYLPEQLSLEEVETIINDIINNSESNNLGDIMRQVVPKVKGRADLGLINKLINEKLNDKKAS
ncbi:MAG: GatB/YqeY domain-containing protein [Bacilli bacterium]|nr:GatB/YqeY domain-containing protein [Bacilli bacterium]